MKNAIKKICAGVIVCAFALGCSACGTAAERQKAEEIIREAEDRIQKAEEEAEKRKQQYQDLLDSLPDATRPTLPDATPPTLPRPIVPTEPQDQVIPEVDAQFYDRIIANSPIDAINERHLRVGGSITPSAAVSLMGFNRYVYSSNTDVVTVSEDCTITAVAPGEANVVIGDGTTYLVYRCIVAKE